MHRREQIISLIKAISHAIMNVHTKIVPLPHEEMYNCFVMKIVNLLIATRRICYFNRPVVISVACTFIHS